MSVRLAIVGWDSATFDVIDPLLEQGRLPVLASLLDGGHRAVLRSTWPPMTDCAWTCAFTGSNPARHGIFGSWYRAPGAYACRYFSSRDRKAAALWELTEGVRHLVWNVPMTFPPEPIEGAMVAGYGAPPGSRFVYPDDLQRKLAARWTVDDLLDRAPHGSLESFRDDLVRGLDVQSEAILWAASDVGAECVALVWPQIDRAQHFFWQFRGTNHPLNGTVDEVYEAMDAATGRLVEAWPEADFLVVSDHGAGPLHGDVNLGAHLATAGRATYASQPKRKSPLELAWALPAPVRKIGRRLAPGMARRAMRATLTGSLGSFDWDRTQAFMGFHGDLWLNLEGREPNGVVAESDAGSVLDEVAAELLAIQDPDRDAPVFAGVHRRSEIYSGPFAAMAPDLMLDSWSAGYRVAPGRDPSNEVVSAPSSLAGVEAAWSADHRPEGIFVAAGPSIVSGRGNDLNLFDVCPTALGLLGQGVPAEIDGNVALQALASTARDRYSEKAAVRTGRREVVAEYSDEEAAAVAEHLKDLGYIE